jgi:hypothetical protein
LSDLLIFKTDQATVQALIILQETTLISLDHIQVPLQDILVVLTGLASPSVALLMAATQGLA